MFLLSSFYSTKPPILPPISSTRTLKNIQSRNIPRKPPQCAKWRHLHIAWNLNQIITVISNVGFITVPAVKLKPRLFKVVFVNLTCQNMVSFKLFKFLLNPIFEFVTNSFFCFLNTKLASANTFKATILFTWQTGRCFTDVFENVPIFFRTQNLLLRVGNNGESLREQCFRRYCCRNNCFCLRGPFSEKYVFDRNPRHQLASIWLVPNPCLLIDII